MGVNEKNAATYHGGQYTPPVRDLRTSYVALRDKDTTSLEEAREEFQRGIDRIRAEAKAEALNEVANAFQYMAWSELIKGSLQDRLRVAQPITEWLRARANQYKEGADNGR